jgi:hypothetical protein
MDYLDGREGSETNITMGRRRNMPSNLIKCEAVKVNTHSGICPGVAKIEQGEVFIMGARTPNSKGIREAIRRRKSDRPLFKTGWEKTAAMAGEHQEVKPSLTGLDVLI